MVKFIKDNIMLISFTDLYGIITYANTEFTEVCEFDNNLIIGFNHNIIRHPDMPEWVFENIWETITVEKVWNGIIKNSTFNGLHCYWVKATIKPLYNDRGKHVGYESIRRQATDIEIEKTMNELGIDLD